MSDTPRTDSEAAKIDWSFEDSVPIRFARQLERELAEARKDTARLDWIRRNCEIHWDMGALTQIMETLGAIDKAMEANNE